MKLRKRTIDKIDEALQRLNDSDSGVVYIQRVKEFQREMTYIAAFGPVYIHDDKVTCYPIEHGIPSEEIVIAERDNATKADDPYYTPWWKEGEPWHSQIVISEGCEP